MSWVAAAIAGTSVIKGTVGAISANQERQRNKGYINDAFRTAKARMSQQQQEGSQANAESLAARGLGPSALGSPIRAAMTNGLSSATTLGEQSQANLLREYGLDRHGLDSEHTRDLNENNAQAMNGEIGSIASGVSGAISGVVAGQEAGMFQGGAGAAAPKAAMTMSGDVSPIRGAFGIHPIDPLGHPDSAWHPSKQSINGAGFGNADFNTGLG